MSTKKESIAQQIANITNSIKALDILQQLKDHPSPTTKVNSITVKYTDGTEDVFTKSTVQQAAPTPAVKKPYPQRKVVVYTGVHNNHATRVKFIKEGVAVNIDGTDYISIAEAGRQLNLHPCTVSARVHSDAYPTWVIVK